ncbi:proclotting enzyme-like [Odontomachus brunneus]|uniref:proclotting enzyme-like n=1 Tax=Odontomachus brunneus TaxID=486640 RepID=UPI0013F296D0|nr:proclotting enzyme-like [Odontomachus brunneus]
MWTFATIYRFVLLYSLCIYQCHCLPADFENITDPAGLENQVWRARFRDSDPPQFPGNVSHPYFRSKRVINMDSGTVTKQKTYQACIAPGNRSGHCKHFSGCALEEFRSNFERYVNYMCIIEQTYIGVCCPDGVMTVRAEKSFDDDLASVLPAIANIDDPEWDETESEKETENGPPVDDKVLSSDENSRQDTTSTSTEDIRKPRRPRGCGMTTKMKTRIVGGQPADPKEWPWMAALLRQGAIQYCGGVLITDRHVLTAAHCVYKFKPRDITVRLGEYDFTRLDETRTLDFMVSEIRVHRDFVYTTYENDIAIIKIHRPTTFNSYIWPICLPPIEQTFENKNAIATGWGTQYYGGPASNVLMEVAVPVWPQERCVRSFTQHITNTTMCAGAYEGGRDACQGDSGGPLLHQLGNGRWVNIGIVSWGIRCGEPGYPGIYTRVNSYLDWIFANAVF